MDHQAADAPNTAEHPIDLREFDPRQPALRQRLLQRTPTGGYVIADTAIVRAIRLAQAQEQTAQRDELFLVLLKRCQAMFHRMANGLRHRPDLYEDAIAAMTEQLWREVLNPNETFMERNFGYYLKCLGIDHFNRVLKSEGLKNKVNEQGAIVGRPEHIPAAMIDRIDQPTRTGDDDDMTTTIADPVNPIEQQEASDEAQRILNALPDPLDRKIVTLRVFYHLKWDEIAKVCKMSERTMRSRFEHAREAMAAYIAATADGDDDRKSMPPQEQMPARQNTKRRKG